MMLANCCWRWLNRSINPWTMAKCTPPLTQEVELAFWNRQKSAPDPIFGRLEHAHAELALATIERELSMMEMPTSEAGPLMAPANGGRTAPSPFVEASA